MNSETSQPEEGNGGIHEGGFVRRSRRKKNTNSIPVSAPEPVGSLSMTQNRRKRARSSMKSVSKNNRIKPETTKSSLEAVYEDVASDRHSNGRKAVSRRISLRR
mmetsp:Transcript_30573/g.64441  ORF Transcript_30573/g.64441 Transcript_30573/m.64441 type:complete len:104 (-) Transcript_30573:964-1275(-)